MQEKFRILNAIINSRQNFILLSHIYSDGDALGSLLAMYHYLHGRGKDVHIFVPGEVPPKYNYLNTGNLVNRRQVAKAKKLIKQAEALIVLDISALDRLDVYYRALLKSPAKKICIDHHPIKENRMDLCLVDSRRIATAEIIYDYFKKYKIKISTVMAEALYTAILSDSGSFRFKGTSAFTLRMAADLVALGVDPSEMYARIYEQATDRQLRAWGKILTTMQTDGFFEWVVVSRNFLNKNKLSLEDVDGLIDIMRQDGQPSVFAVFVEKALQEILVGLRSRNGVDVGSIARSFGGGGHLNAAGFTGWNTLAQIIEETKMKVIKIRG